MHMIRHNEYEMCVPDPFCVSMSGGFKNVVRGSWVRELVLPTLSTAYGNEVACFAGIDPQRNVVRQSFANSYFHRDAALRRPDSAAHCPYHCATFSAK